MKIIAISNFSLSHIHLMRSCVFLPSSFCFQSLLLQIHFMLERVTLNHYLTSKTWENSCKIVFLLFSIIIFSITENFHMIAWMISKYSAADLLHMENGYNSYCHVYSFICELFIDIVTYCSVTSVVIGKIISNKSINRFMRNLQNSRANTCQNSRTSTTWWIKTAFD